MVVSPASRAISAVAELLVGTSRGYETGIDVKNVFNVFFILVTFFYVFNVLYIFSTFLFIKNVDKTVRK